MTGVAEPLGHLSLYMTQRRARCVGSGGIEGKGRRSRTRKSEKRTLQGGYN